MPWWVPSFDNGALASLMAFACSMAGWWIKTMLPSWRAQGDAKAKKIEKDAELAESLKVTSQQQTDLMARQVAQIHDHGIKLDSHGDLLVNHGERLSEHSELLKEIHRQVKRDRCTDEDDKS